MIVYTEPIFQRLCDHFRKDADHVARILLGSACEQWFSAETFAALNFSGESLPGGGWIQNECGKRDLVLRKDNDTDHTVLATFEAKVVYPTQRVYDCLTTLRSQVSRNPRKDETTDTEHAGIVYVAWAGRAGSRDIRQPADFRRNVLDIIKELFPSEEYCYFPQKDFETLVVERNVPWDDESYVIALDAICLTRNVHCIAPASSLSIENS